MGCAEVAAADPVGLLGAVFAAVYAAHMVGDHWVQTCHQAAIKGAPGWAGWWADIKHVVTLTVTKIAALIAVFAVTGSRVPLWQLSAALTVDALSHGWADRRTTLAGLAERAGLGPFYRLGVPRPAREDNPSLGTGAYALDQSWHIGWLFVTALIIAA